MKDIYYYRVIVRSPALVKGTSIRDTEKMNCLHLFNTCNWDRLRLIAIFLAHFLQYLCGDSDFILTSLPRWFEWNFFSFVVIFVDHLNFWWLLYKGFPNTFHLSLQCSIKNKNGERGGENGLQVILEKLCNFWRWFPMKAFYGICYR